MEKVILTLLIVFLASADSREVADMMQGKEKTDRTIQLEATVHAPVAEVFNMWIHAERLPKFFGQAARVDPVPGGEFTILFAPDQDPKGENQGSYGARVLRVVPQKELAFEWTTFVLSADRPGGPPVDPEERLKRPLPTWVELTFEPLDERTTHIRLTHYGFRKGGKWDVSFAYFQRAWATVLLNLQSHFLK